MAEGEHLESSIKVSASIVTYNCLDQARETVTSVLKNSVKYPTEIFVFDNGSSDNTDVSLKKEFPEITVRQVGYNSGFGKAHNLIIGENTGKYIAIINPDISLNGDVIGELVDYLEANKDVCMITPKILNPDGSEQKLPKKVPSFKYLFLGRLSKLGGIFKKSRDEYTMANNDFKEPAEVDFCTGCFFLIRSEVFRDLGGFSPDFFMYFEDAELTLRAKKYGKVVFYPGVCVTHIWNRESAKKLKYLFIHLKSYFIFRKKRRHNL